MCKRGAGKCANLTKFINGRPICANMTPEYVQNFNLAGKCANTAGICANRCFHLKTTVYMCKLKVNDDIEVKMCKTCFLCLSDKALPW